MMKIGSTTTRNVTRLNNKPFKMNNHLGKILSKIAFVMLETKIQKKNGNIVMNKATNIREKVMVALHSLLGFLPSLA